MSPTLVLSSVKWLALACFVMMRAGPSLQASIVAPGASMKNICDARAFRQAIVSICTFQRRDVHPIGANSDRYFYNVNESESGTENGSQGEVHAFDKVVFSQLGKETLVFPVEVYTTKVKRHREFALHRKCCLRGCHPMDFTGVCTH